MPTSLHIEFHVDGDEHVEPPQAQGPGLGNAFVPDEPAPARPAPPRGPRPMIDTVHGQITATQVLERFEERRSAWYSDALAPFVAGIERQLREEARLSTQLQGLPGTDHFNHWAGKGRAGPQATHADGRLYVWQPEIYWLHPIVRRRDTPLNMRVPLAESEATLVAELAQHMPPAWRGRQVVVQLEIETRIYWGGRAAAAGDGDTTASDAPPWAPCSFRGDGIAFSDELVRIRGEESTWLVPINDAEAPLIRRTLRAGVGLLVAVPVVTFELQESWSMAWLQRHAVRLLRWLGLIQGTADRDPTFAQRLITDEAYWAKALGQPATPDDQLNAAARAGAWLAPASPPAVTHAPGELVPDGHLVLVHGGLSSVRGGFGAWLDPNADAAATGTATGPWVGMPLLDDRCVWRFEHDTFVRVNRNINQLIDALERKVIGGASTGRLVMLSHSRGGNVVRFALDNLRQRWPGWEFHGLTAGGPHEGTPVFRHIGKRWSGVAHLLGLFTNAAKGVLTPEQLTDLMLLERALAYDIPPGFKDVEPAGVARMARGRGLPDGLITWGSEWSPAASTHRVENFFAHVIEEWAGLEADGDGVVPKRSALAGLPTSHDASPSFHTTYFEHPPTVAQIRTQLERLLSAPSCVP